MSKVEPFTDDEIAALRRRWKNDPACYTTNGRWLATIARLRAERDYLAAKVVFVHDDRLAMDDDTANAARRYLKEAPHV